MTSCPVESATGTPFLSVNVTLSDANGLNITPDNLNPIQIVNQPIHVTDPSGDVLLGSTRGREDARAALMATLETVLAGRVG